MMYKPECWWWEMVEITRKLLLIAILGYFRAGSVEQLWTGVLSLNPYPNPSSNPSPNPNPNPNQVCSSRSSPSCYWSPSAPTLTRGWTRCRGHRRWRRCSPICRLLTYIHTYIREQRMYIYRLQRCSRCWEAPRSRARRALSVTATPSSISCALCCPSSTCCRWPPSCT